ncbi:MAG: Meiotic Sister-Chromatid recombination aldehyde dehydrogenase [Watsoniomyces obsoletus]|nr:MAG: Meiotic Sister-Chromatid recombination aldehyde dehydrogenase [Watsoniomyces obsoletus]
MIQEKISSLPHWLPTHIYPSWSITALLSIIFPVYLWRYYNSKDETPIPYTVDIPTRLPLRSPDQPSSSNSSLIQCYSPSNGSFLGSIEPDQPEDIDRKISKATTAQKEWGKTSFSQRRKVLKTILKYVLDHQESIAKTACLDSGKTMIDASFGEILVTAEKLKWTILHGEASLRPERRPTSFLMAYKINEVRWEPLGVVAACFHNIIGPIISSIFTGNSIIIKGSELTAWSSNYFISIARTALDICGHSPEVIQSVICLPEVASHLTSHPGIRHLTFIGSRKVGHLVASSASRSLIPVCMELGGKDSAIILDDMSSNNLHSICSILMRGVFQSAGQNCIGIERIIGCRGVYDHLIELLEPRIRALKVGNALEEECDIGAMIFDTTFSRLEKIIEDAINQGARCLVGGSRFHHPKYPKGCYFKTTLLVDVRPEMTIAKEEVFGPVCVLMKAGDIDHAIRIANATEYDLGASVFGKDMNEVEKVVKGVRAGMVSVNDFAVYYAVQLPFGGVNGSGESHPLRK